MATTQKPRQKRPLPGAGQAGARPVRKPAAKRAGRDIAVANRHPRLHVDRPALVAAIRLLDEKHATIRVPKRGFLAGELSIVLVTDAALAQLHGDFLADPSVTDVITFEGDAGFGFAGEICVSADAAARQVKHPRRGFQEELMLYIVHGWLHLAGYDDLQPAKKRAMRRAEARAMTLLRKAGLIPRFRLG